MGLLGIYISVYQSIINTISNEFSISGTIAGIVISLHFIGSMIAPIIFGEISDRIGNTIVSVISFNILISGLLLVYLSKSLILISSGIFLIGCGFAVAEGILSGVLSDMNPGETNKVMNLSQMFFSIGAVAGPMISLLIINVSGNWKNIFILMIIAFTAVMLYLSKLRFTGQDFEAGKSSGLISLRLFRSSMFVMLVLSILIYVGLEEGIAFWIDTYFVNLYNSSQLGAYALSGYWASMIIGRYLASKFHNRYKVFLTGGLIVSLVFFTLGLLINNSIISMVCFIGTGAGFSAIWPIIMSITSDAYPEYRGTALGIMMTSGAGGGALFPFILGMLSDKSGIQNAFWIVPAAMLLILGLQARILRYRSTKQE
jgi:fucose permease